MNCHSENEEKNSKNIRLPKAKECVNNKGMLNCLSIPAGSNKRNMKKNRFSDMNVINDLSRSAFSASMMIKARLESES